MAKPKKFNEIKQFNNKNNIKKYLQDNPDKLREFFVDKGFDFDDMEFDIDSDFVCCPFCRDNGYHGQVNYNEEKDTHNIYCYKCSEINNNGRAYTPWDYLTKVYRVNQGGLSFLDAVISLYNSPEDFTKAYEGHAVERNQKIIIPREDKQQELIDNIYNNCNGDILPFIDELYSQCTFEEIEPYINLYNNIPDTVASAEWDDPDQNVQIFGLSKLPIKVITRNAFDKFVSETEDTGHIRNLFSNGTYFLYMIPTVTPSGKIVQIAFRIVDGEPSEYKPKVKKVKAKSENINIPTMFGFHNFTGFKRGMPIVLVEGEKDAIAMQTIYPYTLAMGRNTLGNSIKYLKYLTDKFIIIPDNDGAGLNGYEKIKKDMDRYGLKLKRISINNPKLKDVADVYVADVYTNGSWESIRKIMTKLKAKFNIN